MLILVVSIATRWLMTVEGRKRCALELNEDFWEQVKRSELD
jgi:hypothetical protein